MCYNGVVENFKRFGGIRLSDDIIKKLTLEINKHESLEDKELKIIKFQLLRKSMILKVVLRGKEKLAHEEEELIKKIICKTAFYR